MLKRPLLSTLRPTRVSIAALSFFIPVAFAIIAGFMLYQERASTTRSAMQQADNIAAILQDNIEHTVQAIDAALTDVRLGTIAQRQQFSADFQQSILLDRAMRPSDYGVMLVMNDLGATIFDSRSTVPRQTDFATRDWFKIHRENANAGLVIELNPRGLSNLPVITFSRGLKRPDGSFGGVVVVMLRVSLFKEMFSSLNLGDQDDLIFRMIDGRSIYVRSVAAGASGTENPSGVLYEATKNLQPATVEGFVDDNDGGHLFSYHRLGSFPLAIIVALSAKQIYAAWWSEVQISAISVGLFILISNIFMINLRRELRRRERAEAEVSESELKFRLIADNASDTVSRANANGERDYVSPSAERLLGVGPEHLLGAALWSYVDERDKDLIVQLREKLKGGATVFNACFRVYRIDGQQRWVEAVAKPLKHPVTDEFNGYVSAWRDITDRKQAETRLSESEARYRALADNASDVIICLDLDLRRTYVSPSSKGVLGYEPEELLGFVPGPNIFLQDLAHTNSCFKRLQSGESDRDVITCKLRHKAGHFVWIEARLSLIRDPITADPASILCALRDVSEQKTQEETLLAANIGLERLSRHLSKARDASEQANKAKSRFLASISHELRTPLNGILGYTQLLQIEGGLSPKQAERVESMISAGQHLLEMINRVLNISEIEAGHFELRPLPINLGETIKSSLDLVRPAAESKSLSLSQDLGTELPSRIIVDPIRLRQVLLNLIGNAVKYTNKGGVSIRARQVRHLRLTIEVFDSGPGIAEADRDRLFQDFERLGAETDCYVEGAGVGLALSRRLVVAMGGSIGYEPNPTGGSDFWFELPMQPDDFSGETDLADAVQPSCVPKSKSLRVLVVDDVAINRDVTASFLETAGHHATCTSSGEDSIALAASMNLDLILMDVRMPGIGGLEAARQIRALTGPSSQIPIVALTAQAFAEEIAACHAAGMDAHLTKPFTRAALLAIMEKARVVSLERRSDASRVSAGGHPVGDDDHPLFDLAAFRQTVDTLPAAKIASHLRNLIDRTEKLLASLRSRVGAGLADQISEDVVGTAHVIAGSASVFGFMYLASVARNYEYAALHQPGDLPKVTSTLIEVTDRSLLEMDRCAARVGLSIEAAAC